MRLALTALLVATGCTDEPPSGPAVDSFVSFFDLPAATPPELDVLIVLDDTSAMAPYQSELAALPARIATMLLDPDGAAPSVRIALTTTAATGTLRQPATSSEPFLAVGYDARYARTQSFTGSLEEALTELVAVGTTSTAAVRPLEAVKQTLDTHGALLRPAAALGVVTIAGADDASSSSPSDYATALKARKSDPARIVLSSIYPDGAPRLDEHHAQFPNRAEVAAIESADFAAFQLLTIITVHGFGVPCVREPADVDPITAGPQYDCDVNAYYDDGTTEAVRQCRPDSSLPCFELVADEQCGVPEYLAFRLQGFATRYTPAIRGQCVVLGER